MAHCNSKSTIFIVCKYLQFGQGINYQLIHELLSKLLIIIKLTLLRLT